MIRFTRQGPSLGRVHALAVMGMVLGFLWLGPQAQARSLDEAIDEIGGQLGRQLGNQQARSFGALQFVNLDGPQTPREQQLADSVARRIGQAGASATYIGLTPSERARAKFGLPPGANVAGETAARIAKLAGADAMLIGTVRRIDAHNVELIGQIFSAQRGINLADARTTFDGSLHGAASPPEPAQPAMPSPATPSYEAPPEPRRLEPSNAPKVMTIEVGQFAIELHECRRSAASVDCALVLVNQGENADFTIFNHKTRLFDDKGREYEPGITVLADKRVDLKGHYGKRVAKQMISGVRTQASVRFPDVASDAESIASLQLNLHAPKPAQGEFRSIPILGETGLSPPGPSTEALGTESSDASGPTGKQTEAGQFLIELKACYRHQTGVKCDLVLTNQGANVAFTIFNHKTRLFDDRGREHEPSITVIADQRADIRGHYGKRLEKQIIAGVPTNASIHFPNVDSDAQHISSLQLNLSAPRAVQTEFKDVSIGTH